MGVNAYRCAHNPPAAEFLDACDRLGMLVMDENRNFNTAPDTIRQLEWLVRRDRNHPCVILWSVFNEEPMQGTEQGREMVRRMSAAVKRLDTTRPVTAAMSAGHLAPENVSQAVDVVGFNYSAGVYDAFHAANPRLPSTSSEDTSSFMTRGEYFTDLNRNILGSYDTECASWGLTHRAAWRAIAGRKFLAGSFIWTGFDYRGEPSPLKWPSAGSFFGCLDQCGFPKMAFYLHQAQWVEDQPVLTLVPHWNWPGREGQPIQVMALSNADTVILSLNGRSLGEKPVDPFEMVSWDVPYEPGRLEAVGKKNGREVSRFSVETTGAPVSLRLVPDRSALAGDGLDAMPVTVEALDQDGRPVPTANLPVEFESTGPGQIIGLGNGDPNCHEPEKGTRRSLFNGLAQVIVQSQSGGSGKFTLCARADGLNPATVTIRIEAAAPQPLVAKARPVCHLQQWRMSPATANAPDANEEPAESDQNTWQEIQPGHLQSFDAGSHAVYRIRFRPFAAERTAGGRIVFQSVTGKAEVWLDQKLAATKSAFDPAPMAVALPPGEGERILSVRVEAQSGRQAGLGGSVRVAPENPAA
jgi:beta-galactosidase